MYAAVSNQANIQNEEEILSGHFESELERGSILENSEKVKVKQRAMGPDTIIFTDGTWYNLSNDDLIKGSVVVTNSDETIPWTEGVDYEIDYAAGKIRRVIFSFSKGNASGTSVGTGSAVNVIPVSLNIENTVKIHYKYFVTKVKDFDYSINYERGSLSRKEGGSLVSGVKVFVDYKVRELVTDSIISLSIDQAHVWIIDRIGTEYESAPDNNLKYGEAYMALHLISKMSAANIIYEKRSDDVDEIAKELKKVSEDYKEMGMSFLRNYIKFPLAAKGGRIIRNRSWKIN
jgi:hypothetical protein